MADAAETRGPDAAARWLPLRPATLHILLALLGGPRHGYAIMQDVAATGEGQVTLGPGTLYSNLHRLSERGLVYETAHRPDPDEDDERRRYYALTELGEAVLRSEIARLEKVVRTARAGWATS